MDRILLIDFNNFAWLANVSFGKPKPKPSEASPVEGYEDDNNFSIVDAQQEAPKPEPKEVPPENVLIFNYFRNLRALIEPFAPHKVVAVLEGHPAFRYELYADYKANRIIKTGERTKSDAAKAEAKARFDKASPEIIRLMKYLPITTMRHPQYEADDVIGSLVEDAKNEDVIVVSNDTDYIQLLQKGYQHFRLYSPSKKTFIQAPQYHYLTWKCLSGDRSDCVKGMMGPKTAEKLTISPEKLAKWLENEEHRALFSINKRLIEFAPVNLNELEVVDGKTDFETLRTEFQQYEFASIVKTEYWTKFRASFKSITY
jgi:5'-3' exonuclease